MTCCSQVFDADGGGLEFIAYDVDDIHLERDNPFLSRVEARRCNGAQPGSLSEEARR